MKGLLTMALVCGLVGISFATNNNINTETQTVSKPTITAHNSSANLANPQTQNNTVPISQKITPVVPAGAKAPAREMNYQGWLGNENDTTGVTGDVAMIFRIYDAVTAGAKIWEETHLSVHVEKGIFNVILGSATSLQMSDFFDAPELWLETQVGNDTLAPRKKIVHVPYSIYADKAMMTDYATNADTANYAKSVVDKYWDSTGTGTSAYVYPKFSPVFQIWGDTAAGGGGLLYIDNPKRPAVANLYKSNTHTYLNYRNGTSARYAGYFMTTGDSAGTDYAIYASCPSGEWAGYFNGNVNVTEEITAPRLAVSFFVLNSGSDAAASGWQKVDFNSIEHNDGAAYDSTNDKFVAPYDGVYHFSAQVGINDGTLNDRFSLALYKNGSSHVSLSSGWLTTTSDYNVYGGSATLKLNAGDEIDVRLYTSGGCTHSGSGEYTNFSGHRVY